MPVVGQEIGTPMIRSDDTPAGAVELSMSSELAKPGLFLIGVDRQLLVFANTYSTGPRCVAQTERGRRCNQAVLPKDWGWSERRLPDVDGHLEFVNADFWAPAEVIRQRCADHVDSPAPDVTSPMWEPFNVSRHSELIRHGEPAGIPEALVVRDDNGQLRVYDLGPQCMATVDAYGRRCAGTVPTPDEADGTWTETVVPGFSAPLKVFNVGYGSCGQFSLQLCSEHTRDEVPSTITGGHVVPFDPDRHGHLVGAKHLEEASRLPSSYRDQPRYRARARVVDHTTALYRYWDDQDHLLYIGITGQLDYRERSHIKRSSWMDFAARSTIERYPTRWQAGAAEREAIEAEHPLFNYKHNEGPDAARRLVEYLVAHGRTDLLAPAVSRG